MIEGFSRKLKLGLDSCLFNEEIENHYTLIEKYLKEESFVDEFTNNSLRSSILIGSTRLAIERQYFKNKKYFELTRNNLFYIYLGVNLSILFLFRNSQIKSLVQFIKLNQHTLVIEKITNYFNIFEDKKRMMLTFYLPLKWFYSDKTKHLYSKELLKQMQDYEREIKKIKWEDCIRKPSKFDRLRF